LKRSLPTIRLRVGSIGDYISSDEYKIIKVHGSIQWMREVDTPIESVQTRDSSQITQELIRRMPELRISARFRFINSYPIAKLQEKNVALFPAIAIPVQQKDSFECPDEHLRVLRTCIPETRKLLIIGWRGMDEHFVKLLRALRAPVKGLVVAGSSDGAQDVARRLGHLPVDWTAASTGFSDLVVSGRLNAFLTDED